MRDCGTIHRGRVSVFRRAFGYFGFPILSLTRGFPSSDLEIFATLPQSPCAEAHNHPSCALATIARAQAGAMETMPQPLLHPENEPSARPRDDLPLMPAERSLARWTEMP